MRNCIIGALRVKIVARCQILWLKGAPNSISAEAPTQTALGGSLQRSPDPLAEFKGPTSLPTCLLLTHLALCQRVRGVIARTRYFF